MQGARGENPTSPVILFYSIILLTVACDQATKFLAVFFLSDVSTLPVFPDVFHLTLVHNTGIAFGLFRDYETLLLILITASLLFLLVWAHRMRHGSWLSRVGFALILGGAFGNWIDRLRVGAVIDFLDFRVWPVFNLADTAISTGVVLYLILVLRERKKA